MTMFEVTQLNIELDVVCEEEEKNFHLVFFLYT